MSAVQGVNLYLYIITRILRSAWPVLYQAILILTGVPLELRYLVFTRVPGESYCRRLRSLLLYLCYVV